MDEAYRLKIKIGDAEFEAEGSVEVVQEQFEIFKGMVAAAREKAVTYPKQVESMPEIPRLPATPTTVQEEGTAHDSLFKIIESDKDHRIASLTARPASIEDAILVILLAQKWLNERDTVSGAVIIEGLKNTGGMAVPRIDRILEKLGREGNLVVIGSRRSKRYRLTNAGVNRAVEIANPLIRLVA